MEQNSDNKKKKKKLLFLVFSLIVVTIGMIIAIALITSKQDEPKIDIRSFEEIFWDSETVEEAISEFQKKIDSETDEKTKSSLCLEIADFMFNTFPYKEYGYLDLIEKMYLESIKNNQTYENTAKIYNFYQYTEQIDKAKQYEVKLMELGK